MEILIVQDYLRCGGTEQQTLFLAQAWTKAHHPTRLLTFRPGGALLSAVQAARIPVQSLQSRDTGLNWHAPGLIKAIARNAPDLVVCMGRMANSYAWWIRRRLPHLSVVSTVRTGKSLPWFYRLSLRNAPAVVANSRAIGQNLTSQRWVAPDKLHVIRNALVRPPVHDQHWKEARRLRPAMDQPDPEPVMLKLAMFRPEKNHRWLLETLATLPGNWQLWLLGDGPTRSSCETFVAQEKLSSRVHFFGQVEDPVPYLLASDLVVHSSLRESLPNALVEAQSLGKAIVALDVGGVRECFLDSVTGSLVPPGEQESFRQSVASWLFDPVRREEAITPAQQHFTRNFSPDGQVAAYLDLFARIMTPNSP